MLRLAYFKTNSCLSLYLKELNLTCKKYSNSKKIVMKYLNVAEKNDAAKTIAALLSNGTANRREGYSVYNKIYDFEATVKGNKSKMVMTSVSGHLLNLEFLASYRSWLNVDPRTLFDAPVRKTCAEDYQPIKRTLEREIKGCQGLIIWTDCDREGENIGFEIVEVCRAVKPSVAVYRAVFSEITAVAVHRALQQLIQPNKQQSDAVDVRTELDLRTGAAITRFQTLRLQRLFPNKISDKLISYGSCQIPTMGFVVERYKEVEAFVSEPFWKIKVIHTIDDLTVEFFWSRTRLFDKEACENYLLLCIEDPKATVESVSVKPKNKWRPTPLDTVEMEKLSSRKLKISAKETMVIAEKLYSKGIISYPRTETNQFSKEIDLRALVQTQSGHEVWGAFANRILEWGPNPRNGNKSDQAHPPIHPTKLVANLEGKEARVYELICRHFLACVSKDATGSETVVNINIAGEKFTATGLCIYERNYLDVYIYDKWNAKQIHAYEQGQVFNPTEISMHEGATTAPPLLTEADLIALMDKNGIGTDATHAEHINTIKERGYIGVVDKGFLVPGVIGMGLYEGYEAMRLLLAKPVLRAEFEADLKRICLGEKDPNAVLQEYIQKYKESYGQILEKVTALDEKVSLRLNEEPSSQRETHTFNSDNNTNNPNYIQELFTCPKCLKAPLGLKRKKNQTEFYISCLNFPDCKNAIWLPEECQEPSVLPETCQKCGSTVKLLKVKLKFAYYKSLFNTPDGWYKTCLRCDETFRNTFNINIENVKRVGAIISNGATTLPTATHTSACSLPSNNSNARPSNSRASKKKDNKKGIKSTATAESVNNIRQYCTSAKSDNNGTFPQATTISTVAATTSNQFEDFFSGNDGFDDVILNLETKINTTTIPVSRSTSQVTSQSDVPAANISNNSTLFRSTGIENAFDDSFNTISADFDLDSIAWGTEEHRRNSLPKEPAAKRPHLANNINLTPQLINNAGPNEASSNSGWVSSSTTELQPSHIKCSGCHQPAKECTVKKDGPNKGRIFYVCPKNKPCKFFQWNDEAPHSNSTELCTTALNTNQTTPALNESFISTEAVQCSCGIVAKSLIVRKDGPNKGRPFYSCTNRSCDFFKWGDENVASSSNTAGHGNRSNYSWGTGNEEHATGSNNRRSPSRDPHRDPKPRKCGLCRQPGHTKLKCPRKAEFEF